ncbi:hypothetical protein [Coraliomargarita akajimensis]|uniref:Uncharacterized protein n=1 Tax=Coraliomargarita akajimensis (strain DSM 45221 / IAM 15411 / JCM 23193 / KCTC 12865 / 04OKA010-24) TaxID=583355 RepID=D5ENE8_CORAD|nr:hypothetical protein [Coraliomargarita akajimensis]ADE55424.1 hypothetical protein Caka_2408 [Coraliomargarita akajimensis DSM 45221]
MISFFPQRMQQSARRGFCVLGLIALTLVGQQSTFAQSSEELFRATWVAQSPDQGNIIVILKQSGRASYFWADNADRKVYQGTWTADESGANIQWENGGNHRLTREAIGFKMAYTGGTGIAPYESQAQQVPKEILGQWAKPPSKDKDLLSDRDQAKGFFGTWKIETENETVFVFIEPDRSAATTWDDQGKMPQGFRGAWAKQGAELHIVWNTGHYSILRQSERDFTYKTVQPGMVIEDDKSAWGRGSRTNEVNVPADWLEPYRIERETYKGGIAFSSRKQARNFYRGEWLVKHGEKSYEKISLGRFGGLSTSRNRKLEGNWLMSGQDIFLRWDDGLRNVLSPIGNGFLIYEYIPGRPLDGVPNRVRSAAPTDTGKLAKHLKGRADVAEQMIVVAEAAGVNDADQTGGWGRTFSRWVWPFGADKSGSSDALLQDSYDEGSKSANDPWWWVSWSEDRLVVEQQEEQATTENVIATKPEAEPETVTTVEVAAADETTSDAGTDEVVSNDLTETQATETPATRKRTKWYWPF